MPFSPIEEIVEDIKQGKMVIVCDDEDRENEGDLTMAAELVTADDINFMAAYGRGLICLPMAGRSSTDSTYRRWSPTTLRGWVQRSRPRSRRRRASRRAYPPPTGPTPAGSPWTRRPARKTS